MDEQRLRRKNVFKVIRTVFEILVIAACIFWVVRSLWSYRSVVYQVELDGTAAGTAEPAMISGREIVGDLESTGKASGTHFIALSYNGLTEVEREGGKIVTQKSYEEQIKALKASGYQTITQKDVLNFYQNGGALPEKALLLIFEDGIAFTAWLAQPAMEENNYIATMCTYAQNLSDEEVLYINSIVLKALKETTFWEAGSNGYRLSYINVFDRFENYFGDLNTKEFLDIHTFLKRDYNHYLMDFLRDENRLRRESEEEMEKRLEWDYEKMSELYTQETGSVPSLYILMHSNTGAFGNDPLVSRKNAEMMEKTFGMNFNRQGTCLNMRDSSIYDLSRLQSRQYFSTNHLMMRIWDDTGHDVMFCLGDENEAANWKRLGGVSEFADRKIIVTSLPWGEGGLLLNRTLPSNIELTASLEGNIVGQQSIVLRADENGTGGIVIKLHNNVLYIEEDGAPEPIFEQDLFTFDGGPFRSLAEEELAGKIALAKTIIENDFDDARILQAQEDLAYLERLQVPSLADGAEPYIPELDIDEQDRREIRLSLSGNRLSLWLDGKLIADHLKVSSGAGNRLALFSAVTKDDERFSQTNLSDDVYDAIFRNLRIMDDSGRELYAYADPLPVEEAVSEAAGKFQHAVDKVINWFSR